MFYALPVSEYFVVFYLKKTLILLNVSLFENFLTMDATIHNDR